MYLYEELMKDFTGQNCINIGSLEVRPFSKLHDAADPYSFTISAGGVTVGVFTDLGRVCSNLVTHFRQCHAALLESNYGEEMLDKGHYPWHLKQRIRGGQGHLSNREALELFVSSRPPQMTHLWLGHLSQNNNDTAIVARTFAPHAGSVDIQVASRYEESCHAWVRGTESPIAAHYGVEAPSQLALFE
jgi:phosphoribosyl 1,2-cyclic phosphodiesterase